jgi:hypothetical protein
MWSRLSHSYTEITTAHATPPSNGPYIGHCPIQPLSNFAAEQSLIKGDVIFSWPQR